jgi:molecular chaperone GrpE
LFCSTTIMTTPDAHQNNSATNAPASGAGTNPRDQATAPDAAVPSSESDSSTALKAEIEQLKDQVLRAHADVQNARRRAEEDVAKTRKFALESFAESLLPVMDSLEAGLALKDATAAQVREGAEATLRQLKSALERNKVMAIDPAVADKFNPHQHQAISTVPAEQEANTVVTVLQKGYLIADRVLRPALVTVAS